MSPEVKPEGAPATEYEPGLTVADLLGILAQVPDDAEVILETRSDVDGIMGAIYLPRLKSLSLIGQDCEVDIDEQDVDNCTVFGDIELYTPSDDDEVNEEDEVEANQELPPEVKRIVQHALAASLVGRVVDLAGPPSNDNDLPFDPDPEPPTVGEVDAPPRPAK